MPHHDEQHEPVQHRTAAPNGSRAGEFDAETDITTRPEMAANSSANVERIAAIMASGCADASG